jgi:sugar lactone lactonase YvrE
LDYKDNLYVVDAFYNRVQKWSRRGKWELFARTGNAPGEVVGPKDIAVDVSDNIYLIDDSVMGGRLQKRLRSGQWTVLAERDTGQQPMGRPYVVGVGLKDNVYVWDEFKDQTRLRMLDSQGQWKNTATQGTEPGQIGSYVGGVATDANGNLYIADTGNSQVQVRDAAGKWWLLAAADVAASGPSYPQNVTVDRHNVVYVTDASQPRVYSWTPEKKTSDKTKTRH